MLITNKDLLEPYYASHRLWQGIPAIAHTKGGRTFVAFYSGTTKETYGNYIVLLQSNTPADFGEPIAVVRIEGRARCFDPVLWIDPQGRLWFIWNTMPGEKVYASVCDDPDADRLVWGEEFYIGRGVMMNKPTVLSSGEWLFPIAVWKADLCGGYRKSGPPMDKPDGSYVYKTSDNGTTFTCMGMADIRNRSYDEHMVLELQNGMLMMLVRTYYGIGVSYSYDRGNTWSNGANSKLGGPVSRFFIGRLRSGRILFINHVNFTGRNNLTAMLSEDDGKTFPYSLMLDERSNVSYPDAMEENGYIHIVYDRERGAFKNSLEEAYACAREILTARITEEDILNGHIVSDGSFLKNVVSKLGKLSPEDPDPFQEDIHAFIDSLLHDDGDVIEKIFARYPINCIDGTRLDMNGLDALIGQLCEHGFRDRELLVKIINLIRTAPKTTPDPNPIIQRICTYIENNLAENVSIRDIAKEMNISVYYLSHLFKSVTGTTIIEYRNALRLTKAKKLLISTNDTVSQIASQCGFCNVSYFTELFSRSEKIPPTEYRKYHS